MVREQIFALIGLGPFDQLGDFDNGGNSAGFRHDLGDPEAVAQEKVPAGRLERRTLIPCGDREAPLEGNDA